MSILLGSKLRKKLLTYSFSHLDESYYVRELSSLLDEDPGNLSRELRILEEEGIYNSHSRGKTKFYSLNREYPLFKELKKIVFKTTGVEGSLKEVVSKFKGVSMAFIYGSYARGKEKKTSDIDLVVVGRIPEEKFTGMIRQLESKLNREINFTYYSKEEFEKERRKEGGFLNEVLRDNLIILKGTIDVR